MNRGRFMAADVPIWDGDIDKARALQVELAGRVRLADEPAPPRLVAGVEVGFEEDSRITCGAAALLEAATLALLAEVTARIATRMPHVPGLVAFRELPAMLQALAELPEIPDLVFVAGLGVAHPRGLGIAAHLGVITDLPAVGVAEAALVGTHGEVGPHRGDRSELLHRGRRIGTVLRTKDYLRPLVVSPGHRVSHDGAIERVLACCRGYRLPEPLRRAHCLAVDRGTRPVEEGL